MRLYHDQSAEINDLLVGRRIVEADQLNRTLTLDTGTVLTIEGNEGCGGCSSGWYDVKNVAVFDNVITSVNVKESETKDDWDDTRYELFVYAAGVRTAAATIEGTDGNGYYGTGFHIEVSV